MDTASLIALIFGIIGGLTGAVGIWQARSANKIAEQSKDLAKDANIKADTANRIAADANEISSEANLVSQRALAVTEDQTEYDWQFKLDTKTSVLKVKNNCAFNAKDLTCIVRQGDETISKVIIEDVPDFGEFTLEGNFLIEQMRAAQEGIDRLNREGGVFFIGTGTTTAHFHLSWYTETGAPHSEVVKKKFSY